MSGQATISCVAIEVIALRCSVNRSRVDLDDVIHNHRPFDASMKVRLHEELLAARENVQRALHLLLQVQLDK